MRFNKETRTSCNFGGDEALWEGLSYVAARSHRASSHASWATDVWKMQHEMLQLQERLDDAMRSKGEKWRHGLGASVTGITKQGVRLPPPKL